jgi:hypothetical protein
LKTLKRNVKYDPQTLMFHAAARALTVIRIEPHSKVHGGDPAYHCKVHSGALGGGFGDEDLERTIYHVIDEHVYRK